MTSISVNLKNKTLSKRNKMKRDERNATHTTQEQIEIRIKSSFYFRTNGQIDEQTKIQKKTRDDDKKTIKRKTATK